MNSLELEKLASAAVSRRNFIAGVGALGGLIALSRFSGTALAQAKFGNNPFSLGVASGDPLPDGIVLWTRLAPDPLNGGGMGTADVPVRWQVASDEGMKQIVQKGTANAMAALGHSVHVEVSGLKPATHYWYQFESGGVVSPVGRTRTAPTLGSHPDRLRFAFASCQSWQAGYYAAYRHMAKQDLDLVVHLGDYIYEADIRGMERAFELPDQVRPEPMNIEQYRLRHALYRLDPDLQATHAAFPFIVTWDDHEVENNYAADKDQNGSDPAEFLKRRAAAYQVYYEHMPLRATSLPHGPDMQLYRRLTFGDLAQFHVLDTRQYRSDQANNDKAGPRNAEFLDPSRVLMGKPQLEWLEQGMDRSNARWNVLAQQIIMAQWNRETKAGKVFGSDAWDGYPAERNRVMDFLGRRKPSNPIVLSGDSHTNRISNLLADFDNPKSAILAAEFAGTSITSSGSTPAAQKRNEAALVDNPHVKWVEGTKRGYVSCDLNRNVWRTDVYQVEDIKFADSPVTVASSWVVENSKPGIEKA